MISSKTIIKIPFYDVDAMSVVWHGIYAKYFEDARCDLFDMIDYNYPQMCESGFSWPIVDLHIRYIKSAKFGMNIAVTATLTEYENRLKINYLIDELVWLHLSYFNHLFHYLKRVD